MAKLSRDKNATTLHPRENLVIAGTIAAINAEIIVDTDGCNSVSFDARGTFSGTIELSGTIDGVQWTPFAVRPIQQPLVRYVAAITGTAPGVWAGNLPAPFLRVRARATAWTSGSMAATLQASTAIMDTSLSGMVTTDVGTVTAAAAAIATLTLAAPGAGLRHYITYIRIARVASVLLTAAATPVVVTTTNLPGALAFSMPADAAPQGSIFDYQEAFTFPIAASAQNTATTIVCPATTGVIWRITAGWYVAP